MAKPTALRRLAILHYKNGNSANDIFAMLAGEVPVVTIHKWIEKFNESGSVVYDTDSGFQVPPPHLFIYVNV